jgi:6-pyruvoyltetrahydropterin/6-carboxytetrahydropterin synthase
VTARARGKRGPAERPRFEICHEFGFDAAHRFTRVPRGHKYRGLHGHSFRVEVAVRGATHPPHEFVADFARLETACKRIHGKLDHALLNEIAGLENPSLENLCLWIWRQLRRRFPGLARVTVRRDSLGQSCTYRGPDR